MKCCKTCRKTSARLANLRTAAVPLILLALLAGRAVPQETTLRAQSNVVLIPALIKDAQGEIVYGLAAKDFIVEDDGVEQSVRLDEAPEGQPISLVLAIQKGRRASIRVPADAGPEVNARPAVRSGNRASCGCGVRLLSRSDAEISPRTSSLIDADLANLQPGDGGAAILDAVGYSVGLLKNEPEDRLRVLLLISETRDHGSKVKIEDSVADIGDSNSLMYALSFSPALSNILDTGRGNNKERDASNHGHHGSDVPHGAGDEKNVPSTVAAMTGGEYELFATKKKFEVRMNDFTNHLHSRYLLSFAPKEPHPGLHQIRVRLKEAKDAKDSTVLARTSYWAEGTSKTA